MFISSLKHADHWQPFLGASHAFSDSLAWISTHAATAAEGVHELGKPGWFVNVHGYTTLKEADCVWENHRHTVDLQYLIDGIEGIDVEEVARFAAPTVVKPESDTEKFAPLASHSTRLIFESGMFAIFMPGETHRPKVAIGPSVAIRKLVVKIPLHLLS